MSGIQWKVAVLLQRVKSVKLGGDLVPLTNEIIALVEQDVARRLLSDGAVEAGSDAMYITIKSEPGTYPLIYMEDVPDFPTGLRAALAAAGITPGDDREGGEGDE